MAADRPDWGGVHAGAGASSALPPLYFLHVWWARRPLTVSRAAIPAGLLPCAGNARTRPLRKPTSIAGIFE